MTRTNRAGRWIRVSGDTQSEEDQIPEIDTYCEGRGYATSEGTLFTVHGKSAYKGAQDPYWLKVVAAFERNEIDVIVIWMVDRLDRKNILHAIPMVQKVLDAGGRIEFSEQPECNLDASDPDISDKVAEFADRIAAAHRESQIKSKRVRKTFKRIDANGALRNRPGYGFNIVGDKYSMRAELNEAEADTIRLAVTRYLDGQSLAHICRQLTANGIRGRNGAEFTPKTLGKILRSKTIIGRFRQGEVVVRVPGIITEKQHKALIAKLDAKGYRAGIRTRDDTAMLTSVLYCGICGRPMYAVHTGGTSQKKVWADKSKTRKITRKYPAPVVYNYYCRPNGTSCKMMILVSEADADVIEDVGARFYVNNRTTEVVIPGHDYNDDADMINRDIIELAKTPEIDGWLDKMAAMQAESARLRALPRDPDTVKVVNVDTVAEANAWQQLTVAGKRAFLTGAGIRIYAVRDDAGDIELTTTRPAHLSA